MNSKVLATVGGRDITRQQMEAMIRSLGPQRAAQFDNEKGREYVLGELINQELFYLHAMAEGMDGEEGFKEQLAVAKANILKQYAVNKTIKDVIVEESEAKAYYEANRETFETPATVSAKHVLVDTEERAAEIKKEIDDGKSFEEAAQAYSKCPSSAQGGNLGPFSRGKMVPEFEAAAFELSEGEISGPVKTQFGYHLIKVEKKTEAGTRAYEEVKNEIGQRLMAEKQRDVYMAKIGELKQQYAVEIL